MRPSCHTESEILHLLSEANAGLPIAEVCQSARISARTFYRWRTRYGGMTGSAMREIKDMQLEIRRLRAMVRTLSVRPLDPVVPAPAAAPRAVLRAETGGASLGRFAFVRGRR